MYPQIAKKRAAPISTPYFFFCAEKKYSKLPFPVCSHFFTLFVGLLMCH